VRDGKVRLDLLDSGKEEQETARCFRTETSFLPPVRRSEVTPDKKDRMDYVAPPNTEIHTTYPMGKIAC